MKTRSIAVVIYLFLVCSCLKRLFHLALSHAGNKLGTYSRFHSTVKSLHYLETPAPLSAVAALRSAGVHVYLGTYIHPTILAWYIVGDICGNNAANSFSILVLFTTSEICFFYYTSVSGTNLRVNSSVLFKSSNPLLDHSMFFTTCSNIICITFIS